LNGTNQKDKGPEYLITGKVGKEVSTTEAIEAAKSVALCLLGTLKGEVGDLDKVKIVKLFAIVNCVDGFSEQPKVVNGASDLLVAVLGENGKHARSAIGSNALPLNVPVEIEMIATVVE
jgi:enamine deaminase RidA (YjgF/YER057c/UK114 family)